MQAVIEKGPRSANKAPTRVGLPILCPCSSAAPGLPARNRRALLFPCSLKMIYEEQSGQDKDTGIITDDQEVCNALRFNVH